MIKKIICRSIASFIVVIALSNKPFAQNSLLVNFGTSSCADSAAPVFSFIKDPLSVSPLPLVTCSLGAQVPDIFAVFIAYNPKNNKIYVADIRSGINTKIWVLDIGLPETIICPTSLLDSVPDYTYSYVSNNFEFDNNGDLWSFSNYIDSAGQCNIDKFDVNSGTVLNTRLVQFPQGNFPTSISSGDITILPNGRMFAVLGSFPSKLYEIKNYNTSSNATALFLDSLPLNCYGIAYLNGELELTGSDFVGNCYYYKFNISTKVLDSIQSFQAGQLPIDNTSISPSLGVTKQLLNTVKIDDATGDFTYEIYVKNLGNVSLNNINVSDNIASVFGAANISKINISFVPGSNEANLLLNAAYNGSSDTNLLASGQTLANQTSVNKDYFFKLRLSFRVTNIKPSVVYMNSAVGTATIGSNGTKNFINVADSSNDGPETAVDPNNNGNATEAGENVPTPFNLATLPVKFISVTASFADKTSAIIKWSIGLPTTNSDKFEIQYSADGRSWNTIGTTNINNVNQANYQFIHTKIPAGNLFYRVKEIDNDGTYIYSSIAFLNNKNAVNNFTIFPNPANDNITISAPYNGNGKTQLILYDAVGRKIISLFMTNSIAKINTTPLPEGNYVLKFINNGITITKKILVIHK